MTVTFRGAGSVDLVGDIEGPWSGPPVVLLHGGGQTRHAWGGTTKALAAQGFLAVTLDLRGHGSSDWAPDGDYSISAYADDLRAVIQQIGRPVALVGASLGGLTSLIATGEQPRLDATAVVLVDVTPRMDAAGRDHIGGFMRSHPEGFATVEEAADAVSSFLPHRPRPADVSGLRKNLRVGEDGRYHWHWDPAFLALNRLGEETSRPERFEAAARQIDIPILLVRGGSSEVVSEEGASAFREVVPSAEYVDVPGARHMVAGDQNDIFTFAVVEFLDRTVLGLGAAPTHS
jgi:pimeloyl-ACP methyl ester carboxylesterase